MSPDEGKWLAARAGEIHGGAILEIGSFHGLSLSYMIEPCRANGNKLWSLDLHFWRECRDNLVRWNAQDVVEVLIGDSRQSHQEFADHSLDMAFIDGDHTPAGVYLDTMNFMRKVRPGGLLCGHDFSPEFPGVQAAVRKLVPSFQVTAGSIWHARM
jgi:predicted O-methyltransferase YrrM